MCRRRDRCCACTRGSVAAAVLLGAVLGAVAGGSVGARSRSAMRVTDPSPPPCHEQLSAQIGPGSVQLKDGSLRTKEGHVFPLGTYYTTDQETLGCACQVGTCFFKCCPWGQMLFVLPEEKRHCEPMSNTSWSFVVDLYSEDDLNKTLVANSPPPVQWVVVTKFPTNSSMFRLEPETDPGDRFYLLENATLLVPNQGLFESEKFCMDLFEDTGVVSALVAFENTEDSIEDPVDKNGYVYVVYPVGLLLSLPFLVATFLVYACFAELRNLHGKSLMCHVGAMLAAYLSLVIVQFRVGIDNPPLCKFLGFFIQFSFLSCFFWLNVMCFDIWWTFSGFRALHGSPALRERHKFWAYSLYAWGGPLAILGVTLGLHFFADLLPPGVVRPRLGSNSCFFDSHEARFAYFVGPVSVLLICNMILFVHTAGRILLLRRETRALHGSDSQRHSDERQRYIVYLKLFLVMGLNWVAEIVSSFFPELSYFWIVTDVGNSLQGIFIFVMFVGTGRVKRLLTERALGSHAAVNSNSSTKSSKQPATGTTKLTSTGSSSSKTMPPRSTSVEAQPEAAQQQQQQPVNGCGHFSAATSPKENSATANTEVNDNLRAIRMWRKGAGKWFANRRAEDYPIKAQEQQGARGERVLHPLATQR